MYNHKKPTGDPACPPYVLNAKRIWDLIKTEMDVSDGEGNGYAGGEDEVIGEENAGEDLPADIPDVPPIDDVNHDTQNEDGEDTTENPSGVGGGGNATPRSGVRQGNRSAEASIAGVRVRIPRNTRTAGTPSPSSNFSELMQFIVMRADSESRIEQRRREECVELEERRRREREEVEERNRREEEMRRRERQEAEERRERRLERQLQNQSEMMQMFMMSMMGGKMKRRRDHDEEENDED